MSQAMLFHAKILIHGEVHNMFIKYNESCMDAIGDALISWLKQGLITTDIAILFYDAIESGVEF